jgi:hypothetical protein
MTMTVPAPRPTCGATASAARVSDRARRGETKSDEEVQMRRVAALIVAGALMVPTVALAQSQAPAASPAPVVGYDTMDVCLSITGPVVRLTAESLTQGVQDGTFTINGLSTGCETTAVESSQAVDAPSAEDTLELGTQLASQFFTILAEPEAEKSASLEAFLAPEFQIVRANGDRLGREAYLAAPVSVDDFTISDVAATQGGDVVVVTYLIETTETIDGVEQTTTAPRLSVFRLVDGVWQLSAHASFWAISV